MLYIGVRMYSKLQVLILQKLIKITITEVVQTQIKKNTKIC